MSDARLAGLLFAAALLARIVSWLGLLLFGPDSPSFLAMADAMREGQFHEALSTAYHPLYPLLIAVVRPVAGDTVLAGHAVSVVLGAAAAVPLFLIVRDLFGRPVAIVTTLMYAFHAKTVDVQSDVMTEGTFFFFFLSSMWLTWQMGQEPTLDRAVVLALAAAAAFHTRPEGLLAIVMAVAWPAWEAARRRPWDAARVGAVLLTPIVILVLLSPYLYWVRSVKGHWSLSVRPSLDSAERAAGTLIGSPGGGRDGASSTRSTFSRPCG